MALHVISYPAEQNELPATVTLTNQLISSVCESMITAMANGLPEEAHTFEVVNYVLNECKEMINSKLIKLK